MGLDIPAILSNVGVTLAVSSQHAAVNTLNQAVNMYTASIIPPGPPSAISGAIHGVVNGSVRGIMQGVASGNMQGGINSAYTGAINGAYSGAINGLLNGSWNTPNYSGSISSQLTSGFINGILNGLVNGVQNNGLFNGPVNGQVSGIMNGSLMGNVNGLFNGTTQNSSLSCNMNNTNLDGTVNGFMNGNVNGVMNGPFNGSMNGFMDTTGQTLAQPFSSPFNVDPYSIENFTIDKLNATPTLSSPVLGSSYPTGVQSTATGSISPGGSQAGVWTSSRYGDDLIDYAPKYRFLFKVQFVFNDPYGSSIGSNGSTEFMYVVKQIDKPKVTFEYADINMYNFRTKVLKTVKHEPLGMTFHDDIKNKVLDFFNAYRTAYSPVSLTQESQSSTVEFTGMDFSGPGNQYGASYGLLQNSDKSIIKSIKLYQVYANATKQNVYSFINPRIENFDFDNVDHEVGGEGNSMSVAFNYDALYIEDQQANLPYNWGQTDMLENSDYVGPANSFGGDAPGSSSIQNSSAVYSSFGGSSQSSSSTPMTDMFSQISSASGYGMTPVPGAQEVTTSSYAQLLAQSQNTNPLSVIPSGPSMSSYNTPIQTGLQNTFASLASSSNGQQSINPTAVMSSIQGQNSSLANIPSPVTSNIIESFF